MKRLCLTTVAYIVSFEMRVSSLIPSYVRCSPCLRHVLQTTAMKSKRKKRQDDFQKIKLKVGKKKPRADNATDTNFRSKGIHLSEQLKREAGPTTHRHLGINVSLLLAVPLLVPFLSYVFLFFSCHKIVLLLGHKCLVCVTKCISWRV